MGKGDRKLDLVCLPPDTLFFLALRHFFVFYSAFYFRQFPPLASLDLRLFYEADLISPKIKDDLAEFELLLLFSLVLRTKGCLALTRLVEESEAQLPVEGGGPGSA